MKKALFLSAALLTCTPVFAQELVFGIGYTDYGNISADNAVAIDISYHHTPFHDTSRWHVSWGGLFSGTADGDVFLGAGLVGMYDLRGPWFAELSLMPGANFESDPLTDLGHTLEFRSLLGVGYEFANGNAMSLAITHKSNASIGDFNPGLNSLLLRYHARF